METTISTCGYSVVITHRFVNPAHHATPLAHGWMTLNEHTACLVVSISIAPQIPQSSLWGSPRKCTQFGETLTCVPMGGNDWKQRLRRWLWYGASGAYCITFVVLPMKPLVDDAVFI